MSKEKFQELLEQARQTQIENQQKINELMKSELLDQDGYPSDAALKIIELWSYSDAKGWFKFIKNIWYMASWGWHESEADHDYRKDERVYRYDISTAGWSGNESIIHAMEKNFQLWRSVWQSSRRGGHYEFVMALEEDI